MGQLVGQDGRTYEIRVPRIDVREIESLIESGCPVVTYFRAGGWSGTTRTTPGRPGRMPGARP